MPPFNFRSVNTSDGAHPTLLLTLVFQTHSPLAPASPAPWALGRRDPTCGSTHPQSTAPWLSQDLAALSFTSNSLHWALWTITLLPDVGYWGAPVIYRRHLRLQGACGDEPLPGWPWMPVPSSIPGPVLTAGTGAPDRMRGDSRKPHPSKWRSEEPGMEEDPDLGSGQKLKAN